MRLTPAGQPAAVHIRSIRICPALGTNIIKLNLVSGWVFYLSRTGSSIRRIHAPHPCGSACGCSYTFHTHMSGSGHQYNKAQPGIRLGFLFESNRFKYSTHPCASPLRGSLRLFIYVSYAYVRLWAAILLRLDLL
jgi:hypothetical protein